MNIPYVRGITAKQAHVGIPDGTVEEEYARNGFFGKYAHFYRSHPPTAWTRIEGPLKPRAFDPVMRGSSDSSDYWQSRLPLLSNQDVSISLFPLERPMTYFFRNADADELFFVHQGQRRLETDFGELAYETGDYLLIPRGTVYRYTPSQKSRFLLVQSFSELSFPEKGMLGEHALFDPAVVRVPTPQPITSSLRTSESNEYEVRVQRDGELTSIFYPFHPITTVGWKGTLSVLQLNVRDIRPISCDRYHLPPSAHTTWVGRGFVVCSFLPRPLENGDPAALKVPFYHSNIDFDEVLFYHAGQFFSREGITPGMLTFHPQGIHHGPQPAAIERSKSAQSTQEVAVMIDTQRPLQLGPQAAEWEVPDYWKTWTPKGGQAR